MPIQDLHSGAPTKHHSGATWSNGRIADKPLAHMALNPSLMASMWLNNRLDTCPHSIAALP